MQADDLEIAVRENQRLAKEVTQLRTRVAAFESSRWWRLHPRFALRGLRSLLEGNWATDPNIGAAKAAPTPLADDGLTVRFRDEVVARGHFSEDWVTPHIRKWEPFVRHLEGRRPRILEIGSFEGLSACFFLWRLPDAHVTSIDSFMAPRDYVAYGIEVTDLESIFDRNVSRVDASRVEKLVDDSRRALLDLAAANRRFDLVYVDGSHLALDVIVDAALSWQLLTQGGILIFDDYSLSAHEPDPLLRPPAAIDAFLALVEGHREVLLKQRQVIIRKTD
jgi:predicted O-methyltransferase YrrM